MDIESDVISSENMMRKVKDLIKARHHTQESVANKINVGRKTLNRILNNDTDVNTFISACKVLGIKEIRID